MTFVVRGDDGYRLYVDGREVLADWRDHAATTRSATLDVVAGKSYAVRLEYYDNASTASVSLRYLFENVTDRERRIAAAAAVIAAAAIVLIIIKKKKAASHTEEIKTKETGK